MAVYSFGLYSFGLYSNGFIVMACIVMTYIASYGLYSYGIHSHGLYSDGLYSYGLYSYGLRRDCLFFRLSEMMAVVANMSLDDPELDNAVRTALIDALIEAGIIPRRWEYSYGLSSYGLRRYSWHHSKALGIQLWLI